MQIVLVSLHLLLLDQINVQKLNGSVLPCPVDAWLLFKSIEGNKYIFRRRRSERMRESRREKGKREREKIERAGERERK